ncbi:MAG: pantoate--beta-alanine ligase [Saprospirales bacterium]|nr:pantoate--beta-alanine ligase [Saprospirales bacterium]
MWAFQQLEPFEHFISRQRAKGHSIGFVPTMGALHAGHLSLIRQSNAAHDITVCSIFVNPTQFNDPLDLLKYPRMEAQDLYLLERAHCGVAFLPSEAEVYPQGHGAGPEFMFGTLDQIMEGAFRPGHFLGVAQVVYRFLQMVEPDAIYMGQKDFQQVAIVREMIRQAGLQVRLVMCPTVREENGLAMSSRNVRLPETQRTQAALIYEVLQDIKERAPDANLSHLREEALRRLAEAPGFRPEYVEIVDGRSLQQVNAMEESDFVVACIVCWVGEVRLIDNLVIKFSDK